jgi:hypothetical protein
MLIPRFDQLHLATSEAREATTHLTNENSRPKRRLDNAFKTLSTSKKFDIELEDLYPLFQSVASFAALSHEKKLLQDDQSLRKIQALFATIPQRQWTFNAVSIKPRSISLQATSDALIAFSQQTTAIISPKDSNLCTRAIRYKLVQTYIASIKNIQEQFDPVSMQSAEMKFMAKRCQIISRKNELITEILRLIALILPEHKKLPHGLGDQLTAIAAKPLSTNNDELYIQNCSGRLLIFQQSCVKIEFELE